MADSSAPSTSNRHAMAPAGYSSSCPYIHTDIIVSIAATGRVSLRDYASLRAVCTEWRSALAPLSPYPCLLSLLPEGDGGHSASAFSLPMRRSFHLHAGSSLLDRKHKAKTSSVRAPPSSAVSTAGPLGPARAGAPPVKSRPLSWFVRSGPVRRQPIQTAYRTGPHRTVSTADDHERRIHGRARLVGSGNGRFAVAVDQLGTGYKPVDGGSVASPSWTRRIFLVDPRAGKEVDLVSPTEEHDTVRKIVFAPRGDDYWTIAALYKNSTKVAHMDGKLDKDWTLVAKNMDQIADLALYNAADGKLYCVCLSTTGDVHVFRVIANGGQGYQLQPPVWNIDAADALARPYDRISMLTSTKQLFFCHGTMYQVWQNKSSAAIKLRVGYRISVDEIFLLRCEYDPEGRQRWDVVKDLGGCSVFISKDGSPVVVQPAAFPEVRADCVYWINWPSCVPMVCDIATGTTKPWVLPLPYGGACCKGDCWYFGDDHP